MGGYGGCRAREGEEVEVEGQAKIMERMEGQARLGEQGERRARREARMYKRGLLWKDQQLEIAQHDGDISDSLKRWGFEVPKRYKSDLRGRQGCR
jgi:hypothetical protein